jgi:hypothetical protein
MDENYYMTLHNREKGNQIEVHDEKMRDKVLENIASTSWKVGKPCNMNDLKWKFRLFGSIKQGHEIKNSETIYILSKDTIAIVRPYYGWCEWKSTSGNIDMDFLDNLYTEPIFEGKVVEDTIDVDLSDYSYLRFWDHIRYKTVEIRDDKEIIKNILYGNTKMQIKMEDYAYIDEGYEYIYTLEFMKNEDDEEGRVIFDIIEEGLINYSDDNFYGGNWRLLSGKINIDLLKKLQDEQ